MARVLVTTGAAKNSGDFLIHESGLRLLRMLSPATEFMSVPRWSAADPNVIASSAGVVACGGPGLRPDFLRTIYLPLGQAIAASRPAALLGVGWGAAAGPGLDPTSVMAVQSIIQAGQIVTTRDPLTLARLAAACGYEAPMTGCPAWYDPRFLDLPVSLPASIEELVFTPPGGPRFHDQSRRILDLLSRRFPGAKKTLLLHRGRPEVSIPRPNMAGISTTARESAHWLRHRRVEQLARRQGWAVRDVSYGPPPESVYASADLHVGYRVHAHIFALSLRRPSLLIAEDTRGLGQLAALDDAHWLLATEVNEDRLAGALELEATSFVSSRRAIARMHQTWPLMQQCLRSIVDSFGV